MLLESGPQAFVQRRRSSNDQLIVSAFPQSRRTSLPNFRRSSLRSIVSFLPFEDAPAVETRRQSFRVHISPASSRADRSLYSMDSSVDSHSAHGLWSSPNIVAAEQNFAEYRQEETDAWKNAFALRGAITNKLEGELTNNANNSGITTSYRWKKVSEVKLCGVREDYYSTLLCCFSSWTPDPWTKVPLNHWDLEVRKLMSKVNQDSVFSLNHHMLQQWSTQLGHEKFPDPACYKKKLPSYDRPTGIAVSKLGFIIIAYQSGKIVVRDLLDPNNFGAVMLYEAVGSFNSVNESSELPELEKSVLFSQREQFNYVTHVIWCQMTPAVGDEPAVCRIGHKAEGFLGDQNGRVHKFSLERASNKEGLEIKIVSTVPAERFHSDSICSMVLDCDEQLLAVAGTDNIVRVWRYNCSASNPRESLSFLHDLPQFSAVRSLCFSPVKSDLLLTGGGRHDRTFRVFKSGQTQAVFQIAMPAQIVSIVWLNQAEVFVAFGHSRLNKYRGYGKVVNILTGQMIAELPGKGYLLTALKTQNGFCVHTNQGGLISYTWDSQTQRITASAMEDAYRFGSRSPQLR